MKNSNKEIYSTGEAQSLNAEDIQRMKNEGLSGNEIIKQIVDSNKSMDKRTILSQEKILKKKNKVHTHKIWISPVTLFNIVEINFLDNFNKIKYLYSYLLFYLQWFKI